MPCHANLYTRHSKAIGTLAMFLVKALTIIVFVLSGAKAGFPANPAPNAAIVVRNDRGGLVGRRADEIRRIRAAGQRVEIRGRLCLSSCTMYLGLPGTCVEPHTRFGFHGPSYFGATLSARDFEYWSQLIARHYPEPLRSWYLNTGRMRLSGYFHVSGRELIRLGINRC